GLHHRHALWLQRVADVKNAYPARPVLVRRRRLVARARLPRDWRWARRPRRWRAAVHPAIRLHRHKRQVTPNRNVALPPGTGQNRLQLGMGWVGNVVENQPVEVPLDRQLAVLAKSQVAVGKVQAARVVRRVRHSLGLVQACHQRHVARRLAGVVQPGLQTLARVWLVAGHILPTGNGRELLRRAALQRRYRGQLPQQRGGKGKGGKAQNQTDSSVLHFGFSPRSPFIRSISMRWSVSTPIMKSAMFGSSPLFG